MTFRPSVRVSGCNALCMRGVAFSLYNVKNNNNCSYSIQLLRMPVLTVHSIGVKINPLSLTNQSDVYLKRNDGPTNKLVNDTLSRTSLPWVAFIIMVACVTILSVKLIEGSKVRQPIRYTPGSITASAINKPIIRDNTTTPAAAIRCQLKRVTWCNRLSWCVSSSYYHSYRSCSAQQLALFTQNFTKRQNFIIFTSYPLLSAILVAVNIFIYYLYNSKYRSNNNNKKKKKKKTLKELLENVTSSKKKCFRIFFAPSMTGP